MLAKVYASALIGIDAYPVEVEVDLARGLPKFNIDNNCLPCSYLCNLSSQVYAHSGYESLSLRILW